MYSPPSSTEHESFEGWLTLTQAQRELEYSRRHLYRLVNAGVLEGKLTEVGWFVTTSSVERLKAVTAPRHSPHRYGVR